MRQKSNNIAHHYPLPFIIFDTFSPELVEVVSKSYIWVKRLLIRAGILCSRVIGFFHLLLFDLGFFLGCLLLSFHSSLQLTVIRGAGRNTKTSQRFRAAVKPCPCKKMEGDHVLGGQMVGCLLSGRAQTPTFCDLSSASDKCEQSLQRYMVGHILTTVS